MTESSLHERGATFVGTIEGMTPSPFRATITGTRAMRGSGDGILWRGRFNIPDAHVGRVSIGEMLHILVDDGSRIAFIVTDVGGSTAHFRARGKMPVP